MKAILPLALALLLSSASATKLSRAGFIDCEATGSCAPKKKSNVPKGFVGGVDMDTMYSFAEQDDARKEVAEARKEIEARKVEQAKRDAEQKKETEIKNLEKEIKDLQKKTHQEEEPHKIKGKMAVALGGDVHYVDMPDSEEELV